MISKNFPIDRFCVSAVDVIMQQGLKYNSQLQYCNNQLTMELLQYHIDLYEMLDINVKYLNVGNGSGMLEWVVNQEGNKVDLVGCDTKECNDSAFFSNLRYELKVQNEHTIREYFSKGLQIDPVGYWDYLLFIRFGPLQQSRAHEMTDNLIRKFFVEVQKYGKYSIISKVLLNKNVERYIKNSTKYEENKMVYIVRN